MQLGKSLRRKIRQNPFRQNKETAGQRKKNTTTLSWKLLSGNHTHTIADTLLFSHTFTRTDLYFERLTLRNHWNGRDIEKSVSPSPPIPYGINVPSKYRHIHVITLFFQVEYDGNVLFSIQRHHDGDYDKSIFTLIFISFLHVQY